MRAFGDPGGMRRSRLLAASFGLGMGLGLGVLTAGFILLTPGPLLARDAPWIALREPQPGLPLSGAIEVRADVEAARGVREVRFEIDGELASVLETPPWRIVVDVGAATRSHRIVVTAVDSDGREAQAELVSPALRVDETIDLALRQVYVTVNLASGEGSALAATNFEVFDDGRRQTIVTFERGDIPLTALLLLDASRSMVGDRLGAALAGARAFVERMAELDQAALLLFSDRVRHATPFTSVPEVISAGLGVVEAGGSTSLNDHLYLALRRLERRQGRRVLVLLSDGLDVTSVLPMADVLEVASRIDAQVHWIRLAEGARDVRNMTAWRTAAEHEGEKRSLVRLVERSGGRIWDLDSIASAEGAFTRLLQALREQYVLGYYPPENAPPGWRPLEVRLRGAAGDVVAPEGYLVEVR